MNEELQLLSFGKFYACSKGGLKLLDICVSSDSIESHGVIGNMKSAAAVSLDGTIDFFCFPHFYSPSVFAALLDQERGGLFRIEPQLQDVRFKQLYLPETNILITRYLSQDAVAELVDFMPVDTDAGSEPACTHQIIRKLKVVKGSIRLKLRCAPRFDYGRRPHTACKRGNAVCFRPEGDDLPSLVLHATVPLEIKDGDALAEFTLKKGTLPPLRLVRSMTKRWDLLISLMPIP